MKVRKPGTGKKTKPMSVKELKVCFGKCRCFSAEKTKFKTGR
ncbi:MAG TPA: hypothetical protein VMV05_00760 [bacterium]|nr:hypothetical protein [bacterium]